MGQNPQESRKPDPGQLAWKGSPQGVLLSSVSQATAFCIIIYQPGPGSKKESKQS